MEGTATVAPEQIIINGQPYSAEDASSLIELGNKYRETEKTLNTSLDKLMPEYTRATQRAARLDQVEKDLAERDKMLAAYKEKEAKQAIPEDTQRARQAARGMGLVDEDWIKERGYLTREELKQELQNDRTNQQLIDNTLKTASSLEKEIDGSDGRIPFDQKGVLAYAAAYKYNDLRKAYEDMNDRGNARWKEAQLAKEERPGLTTLRAGGKKAPEKVKVTDGNFNQMWDEILGGTE